MRRWVCIIALLAGFTADGYPRTPRSRLAVPIVRPLTPTGAGMTPTNAWWARF